MRELGEAIKGARRAKGLTRTQLATLAQISPVFISKIEQGTRSPAPPTLVRLAAALGVSAGELLTRAELLDASSIATTSEVTRRLLRAVTVSAGVRAALPIIGIGPSAAVVGAVAFAELLRRRNALDGPDATASSRRTARQRLHDLVDQLSDSDAAAILAALVDDEV